MLRDSSKIKPKLENFDNTFYILKTSSDSALQWFLDQTPRGMKVPSPCEPFGEPSAVPSCKEKGSKEALYEPSDETNFHMKVHVKVHLDGR